jgi:putative ABC transport system permease protein
VQLADSARIALRRTLLASAAAIPGVESASWVMTVPMVQGNATYLAVPGVDSVDRLGEFSYQATTPAYFRTMGTRILRGRGITAADHGNAPRVVVVSASMARTLWPGRDPIGQRLRVFADTMPWATVVGVAEDVVQRDLTAGNRLQYYLSIDQYWPAAGFGLVVKTHGDPARAAATVRRVLQAAMPGESYVTVRPFRELVEAAQRAWRLGATMFVTLGVLALVVAAVGLYGVVAGNVAQRMHELGVRAALGARAPDVVALVVAQGLRYAVAGIGLGSLLALGTSRWLQPLLFEASARDPAVFGGVAAAIVLVAAAASAVPALRAARADPAVILRAD